MCFILNMKDSFLCELEVHQLLSSDQIGEPDLVTIGFRSYDPWTQYADTGTSDNHPPPNQLFANWTSQIEHHLSHLYIPKKKEKWLRHPFILCFSNMDQTNKKHGCLARVFEVIQPKHGLKQNIQTLAKHTFHGSKTWRQISQASQVCPINLLLPKISPPPMLVVEAAEATFWGKCCGTPMCWQKKLGVRGGGFKHWPTLKTQQFELQKDARFWFRWFPFDFQASKSRDLFPVV